MDHETLNTRDNKEYIDQAVYEPEIRRVVELMRASPADAWTIAGLAQAAGMSKSQFMIHFRTVMGHTPMDCLRTARMELASRLLGDGRTSIREVANRVGYSSASAFSHVFKRWAGVAPGLFRREELKVPRIKFANRFRDREQTD